MAHQTPSSSLKKHPRSLRLILAELFSGRVSARLSELEEKVGQMEHRLDDHAVAISNLGARVAMGEVMKTWRKILRDTWGVQANQSCLHGELRWINFNEKDYFQWYYGLITIVWRSYMRRLRRC
ncbi:hypothetical protein QM129_28460 [Klebsiella pneumoniae]|uniref:hypothetical protein n=1 Tax=Klebsiella pneumoniae TaxID=573 RepID=UPI002948C8CA|nr:hypothetical protein [Klebsiella pneumoniae]MDV5678122.1 hypothetical protein [Klebsiella pneumoniae]